MTASALAGRSCAKSRASNAASPPPLQRWQRECRARPPKCGELASRQRIALGCDAVIGPCEPRAEVTRLFNTLEAMGDESPGLVEVAFRREAPDELATDLIGVAAGGLLGLGGFSEDPPNHPKGDLAYKQTSLVAAEAALALVMEKRRTGRGGRIVVSMQEAVNLTTVQTLTQTFSLARQSAPHGTLRSLIHHIRAATASGSRSPSIRRTGTAMPSGSKLVGIADWQLSNGRILCTEPEWARPSASTRRLLTTYTRSEAILEDRNADSCSPVNTRGHSNRPPPVPRILQASPHPQLDAPWNGFRTAFRSNDGSRPSCAHRHSGAHRGRGPFSGRQRTSPTADSIAISHAAANGERQTSL